MLLGTGKANITPPLGTALAGYGRERKANSVLDELELQAFWLQESEAASSAACIVTADIIGFSDVQTPLLRRLLSERFGLPPEAVLLASSHTHSGPQTCENLASAGGPPIAEYMTYLHSQLFAAVEEARGNLRPVTMRAGRGKLTGYAINRRVVVDGTAIMAPNPEGIRDDEVLTLAFYEANAERPRAVLFHYTCHPTLMGDTCITGDYPGAARRYVEKALEGAVVGYLPGCFGDVRPNCVLVGGKAFRRGIPADVEAFGAALGAEVVRTVSEAMTPVTPRLFARTETLSLPLAKEPERASLSLQRLDLAETVTLVALGGEICVDYGHFIKGLRPGNFMVPVGYSNGMVGYVPSARMFPEGGYEPDTSAIYFELPSPFVPAIEPMIQEAARGILRA